MESTWLAVCMPAWPELPNLHRQSADVLSGRSSGHLDGWSADRWRNGEPVCKGGGPNAVTTVEYCALKRHTESSTLAGRSAWVVMVAILRAISNCLTHLLTGRNKEFSFLHRYILAPHGQQTFYHTMTCRGHTYTITYLDKGVNLPDNTATRQQYKKERQNKLKDGEKVIPINAVYRADNTTNFTVFFTTKNKKPIHGRAQMPQSSKKFTENSKKIRQHQKKKKKDSHYF
ncbi:hypothetical protein FN846DRAFT_505766 [Sphaerosporella brunnea]|uniref:Uncharacterized protein n=1 Tax=Sphaerosporella brunnea TaxID=1250544 RepID=A0A5J5F3I7_9PEZI|nr:hypothetical protein FN846DRAFT_505766 [Sphaerosporella brunnea]